MRFLADESCDFSVGRALRSSKHDVIAIAEVSPRALDDSPVRRYSSRRARSGDRLSHRDCHGNNRGHDELP